MMTRQKIFPVLVAIGALALMPLTTGISFADHIDSDEGEKCTNCGPTGSVEKSDDENQSPECSPKCGPVGSVEDDDD